MTSSLVQAVTDVWTAIATWLLTYIPQVFELFYSPETGLTLLGILAIAYTGIALVFLVIGLITNFFRLRT